ncbi:hypothetical protein A9G48_10860 [Gilliamella sp. wkB18]|uniref:acyltransferase family protein n=1 Tax=Gilliamella sp. wkB18 TaxID=3120260 RepID=UPI0004DCE833|nr:acyltransferase family protein [Gilliamella apicola]KFA58545.1 conserved hypothetical acyltransferase [Gilliamella apicola]OCG65346.1 hypothetical protein A9G48_10860 [Gilliamella apicola]
MSIKYRADIDGLRALAVLSVIIFHLNNAWLPGGFIGVDIFFVISGFLITKTIYTEMQTSQFTFKNFYQRRINRILPVFFVVIFTSSFFAWYILSPDEFEIFLKSVKSTTYFAENVFFAKNTGGYFDLSADNMAILHTWSLAVEEQFYIILPFILLFLLKIKCNKNKVLFVLGVIAFLSFCLAQISPYYYYLSRQNYYSLFTGRAGELLIGSIVGIISTENNTNSSWLGNLKGNSCYKNFFSLMGFTITVCSIIFISNDFLFPSFITVIPVVGSALILYFSDKDTLLFKMLSYRPFVFIGLISYSLYLWHWPIISLLKQYLIIDDLTTPIEILSVLITTFILSLLSYFFIETPCRKNKKSFKFSFCCYYLIPVLIIFCFYETQKYTKFADKIFVERFNIDRGNSLRWVQGKDDFLFLGDKNEKIIRKLTLSIRPTKKQLKASTKIFGNITKEATKYGTKVVLLIGADKARIYPEYLPDQIHLSKVRYIDFFLTELRKNKNLIIYDSEPDLSVAAKENENFIYHRTDSHWNSKGAYIAYTGFLKELGIPLIDVKFTLIDSKYGDIADIAGLKKKDLTFHNDDNFKVSFNLPQDVKCTYIGFTHISFGNNEDCINSLAPIDKKVWVIGDSFSRALREYFSATFKNVRFMGHWHEQLPILPKELAESKEKPDIVVIVKIARSF